MSKTIPYFAIPFIHKKEQTFGSHTTWVNFKCIFLTKRRQNQVAKYCVIPFYVTFFKKISGCQWLGIGGEIIDKGVTLVWGDDEIVL